jgi:hypothetical protein
MPSAKSSHTSMKRPLVKDPAVRDSTEKGYVSTYFQGEEEEEEKKCRSSMDPQEKLPNQIIASCTTLPLRVNNPLFKATVESLTKNKRISRIIINYPRFCQRLNQDYPQVPTWMTSHPKIVVNTSCPDFGPLTHVVPLLDGYKAKSDIGVLLFDDDLYYPDVWINSLIDGFERHNRSAAIGKQGSFHKYLPFQFNKYNQSTADEQFLTIKTQKGAIYPFNAFPETSKKAVEFAEKYKHKGSMNNCDILLGSWCHKTDVPLYVVPTTDLEIKQWDEANETALQDESSLEENASSFHNQAKLIHALQQDGEFPVPWSDIGTLIGMIVFAILLILFLSFLLRG